MIKGLTTHRQNDKHKCEYISPVSLAGPPATCGVMYLFIVCFVPTWCWPSHGSPGEDHSMINRNRIHVAVLPTVPSSQQQAHHLNVFERVPRPNKVTREHARDTTDSRYANDMNEKIVLSIRVAENPRCSRVPTAGPVYGVDRARLLGVDVSWNADS